jgi:hypothetical protein
MLERYFVKPQTVDRIRATWIGPEIEQYVTWLDEREYAPRSVLHRVPVLVAFGEFAWAGGARTVAELPGHVEGFVADWMTGRPAVRQGERRTAKRARVPVEQMLMVVIPGFVEEGRMRYPYPFVEAVPGFFEYLVSERGLRPMTVDGYRHHLRRFGVQAAVMLACLAVLEDPDGEQIVAARRSGYGRQGASGASCEVRGVGGRGQHAGFWPARRNAWKARRAGRRCLRPCRVDCFAWRRRRRGYWTMCWPWCLSARYGSSCETSSIRCSPARSAASPVRLSAPAAGTPRTGWLLVPSRST